MGTVLCPQCHQLVSDESDVCALCGASITDVKAKTSLFLERPHQLIGKPPAWIVAVNGTGVGTLDDGGAFLMVEDAGFSVEVRIDQGASPLPANIPPDWTDRISLQVAPRQHRHVVLSQTRKGLVSRMP